MRIVSAKVMRRVPSPTSRRATSAAFDTAVSPSATTRLIPKRALNSGSSKHERAAGVGGLELRDHEVVELAVDGERRTVEADELVVEDRAGEVEVELRGARGEGLFEVEHHPLPLGVGLDRGVEGPAVLGSGPHGGDVEVDGVQGDRVGGFAHLEVDRHRAGEHRRGQVGRQLELVVVRQDVAGQAVGVAGGRFHAGLSVARG